MRTLNLSGIKIGDSPLISVSQAGITAGPYQPPSWGQPNTGGTITIEVDRTTLQCAPDSVRFSVDLSLSAFDTPGPVGSEVYDARMHDLIYLWDFDDPGTWTKTVNVLAGWKNRSTAMGPWVAHMYTQPGTYNPSVLVIEPSSGKTATASLSGGSAITVLDPDDVFAVENTYYINDLTDSDFSDVPVGVPAGNKRQIASLRSSDLFDMVNSPTGAGAPARLRLKCDNEFEAAAYFSSATRGGVFLDTYSSGAKPIVNAPTDKPFNGLFNFALYIYSYYGDGNGNTDFRIRGLDFRAGFDPTTTIASSVTDGGVVLRVLESCDIVMADCEVSGFHSTLSLYPRSTAIQSNCHFDDMRVTNYGGQYQFITASGYMGNLNSSFTMTGTLIEQANDAIDDSTVRAQIRINDMPKTHIRGSDFFSMDSTQPVLKMVETPSTDGHVVNLHSCSLEGGLFPLSFQNNNVGAGALRSTCMNAVVDGLVIVGAFGTQYITRVLGTGFTMRNSLLLQPSSPKHPTKPRLVSFVGLFSTGSYDADIVGSAPVRFYNNTLRSDRAYADNNSLPTLDIENPTSFSVVTFENNILHMPSMVPVEDSFAPLTDAALWTPRTAGRRDPTTLVLDTAYANTAGMVKDSKPGTGSAALGAALSGNVSYMDILGTTRTAPADKGAWEVA